MDNFIIGAFSYDFYSNKGKITFKKWIGRKIKSFHICFTYNTYYNDKPFNFTAIPEELKQYTYKIEKIIIEIIKKIEEVKN